MQAQEHVDLVRLYHVVRCHAHLTTITVKTSSLLSMHKQGIMGGKVQKPSG